MRIIIIHGSRTYLLKPRWVKNLTLYLAKKLVHETPSFNYATNFREYLSKKGIKAEVFRWNAGISLPNIKRASLKLSDYLKKQKESIILFGKSNGGNIAQLAKKPSNVIKIVQVATPNLRKKYKSNVKITNIYSKSDILQKIGCLINSPIRGSRILKGKNAENIFIPHKDHQQLNKENMFDFYYKQIIKK